MTHIVRTTSSCRYCAGALGDTPVGPFCGPSCRDAWRRHLLAAGLSADEAAHVLEVAMGTAAAAAATAVEYLADAVEAPLVPGTCRICRRVASDLSRSGRCDVCSLVHDDPADPPAVDATTPWDDDEVARAAVARNPDGMSLTQIGGLLDVTRERVRQIETEALAKLRARAPRFGLTPADLAHALTNKPVTPDLPAGGRQIGLSDMRARGELSPEAAAPSPTSSRASRALDALDRRTTRLRAWLDALEELDRVRAASSQPASAAPRVPAARARRAQ